MSNYWKESFDKCPEAEGVDFVGMLDKPWDVKTLYGSRTKEQMLAGCAYPRANYLFWKMVDGKKMYISQEHHKIKPGSRIPSPEHRTMFMIIENHNACDSLWGAFDSRQEAEEIAMSLFEEVAYAEALELYIRHHHWTMERAVKEAWKRVIYAYEIKEFDSWSFLPF